MDIQLRFRDGTRQLVEDCQTLLNAIERAHYLFVRREGEAFAIYMGEKHLLGEAEIRVAWQVRNLEV